MIRSLLVPALALTLGVAPAAVVRAADVHVGIEIGVPPPPVVALPAAPQFTVVPEQPPVAYAPGVTFNLFSYGGQYFTFHDGAWFWARTYGEPWVYVPRERVPAPVLGIPVRYYRIPPGQLKKRYRRGEGHGRDHWDHHHRDDEEEHGPGHGHGHGHED